MALLPRSHRPGPPPTAGPTRRTPDPARRRANPTPGPASVWGAGALPPSVARVAARTRLSAELLAAILEVEERTRATLDDIERADALADRLLARRRDRLAAHRADPPATRLSA
ncbi:hypothetical protein [Parafrankia discariae]|uniref:hypothetical protein n=1 Tax=Parafrankia discariae TaxID=365528 RepID=UPI00037643E4|nr:hypothetical protein [Parafrankia discariae]